MKIDITWKIMPKVVTDIQGNEKKHWLVIWEHILML